MAIITNYATLKTAVADYLARSDLTTFIPNFVQAAERKLNSKLNLRNEESALSVSVTSGAGAVPADFKALKIAYVDEAPLTVLRWMELNKLYDEYPVRSGAETPSFISREGTNFVFGPYPKDFTLSGVYYAKSDSLETTDPSWYVTNHPEALLYGALMEASVFTKDTQMVEYWRGLFENEIRLIQEEEDDSYVSRGPLRVIPG